MEWLTRGIEQGQGILWGFWYWWEINLESNKTFDVFILSITGNEFYMRWFGFSFDLSLVESSSKRQREWGFVIKNLIIPVISFVQMTTRGLWDGLTVRYILCDGISTLKRVLLLIESVRSANIVYFIKPRHHLDRSIAMNPVTLKDVSLLVFVKIRSFGPDWK